MTIKKVYFRLFVYGLNTAIFLLLVMIVLGLPFALKSLYSEIISNATKNDALPVMTSGSTNDMTKLEIVPKEIDPVNRVLKMTVYGHHYCDAMCDTHTIRLHISNFYFKKSNDMRVPASISIDIPTSSTEFEKEITLPVSGDVFEYPFDKYSMNIAIAMERIEKGHSTFLTPENGNVTLVMDEQIPRMHHLPNKVIQDVSTIVTGNPVAIAFSGSYERPFYIKYIVSLLVVLLIITTAATILLSEFSQLITGAAGIVLGVWGARSLLLGDLPADVTIIDIILTLIVIGTLISVAIKSVIHTNKTWRNIR